MGDQFPADVIYGILSRLPIKSLARFRCACKTWLEYISDPYLQTIHRVKEEPTPVIFQRVPPPSSLLYQINKLYQVSLLRATQGTTTVKKDHVLVVPYEGTPYRIPVLGSCNGLILFSCGHALLTLINPLTKQRHDLPPVNFRDTYWGYSLHAAGIGFDDSTNTFTTVCVFRYESLLCTMVHRSGMGSWQEMPQNPPLPIIGGGVFAHGRVHWLSNGYGFPSPNRFDGIKVVWFDVKREEFGLTDAPKRRKFGQLVDLNGEVGYAYNYEGVCIKLWVLKQEEWVLRCCFGLKLMRNTDVEVSGCWNNDGDILLTSNGGEKRLFVYTLKTDDMKEVESHGGCERYPNAPKQLLFDPWY